MKRLLIIEDDGDTSGLLGLIAENSNIEVILRSDVLSTTEIEQINPDLILLDHWVHDKLGGKLCFKLKRNQGTKDIPVIIISALNDIGQIAFEAGADGSLTKPFDIDEIEGLFQVYLEQ